MSALTSLPLSTLSVEIAARRISPVDLANAAFTQIDRYDKALGAYISLFRDEAIQQARRAEADIFKGNRKGPLHGIPMGIKDNLYYKGHTTTMGSRIHRHFVPDFSATVVERLAQAGVVFLGKLNLHEYALGVTTVNPHYGTSRNPWNRDKIAGGSSGGAGVAIPCGMSIGSLGSDTSGSIRIPAACCGIAGLKPTYGRVSKHGCFPEAWSLDHVGPMARTATDLAFILDAISGHDPRDPTSLRLPPTQLAGTLSGDVRGKVIGLNQAFFFKDVDASVAAIVHKAVSSLESQGAIVRPIRIAHIASAEYAITLIDTSETTAVHHQQLRERPLDYGDDVRFLIQCGELPSAVDYLEAQQIRHVLRESFRQAFEQVDVLISPTLPIETPDIGQTTSLINGRRVDTVSSLMRLIGPSNLVGLPSASIPCGLLHGMPVGMQIIAAPLQEAMVLNFALALERAGLYTATARPPCCTSF